MESKSADGIYALISTAKGKAAPWLDGRHTVFGRVAAEGFAVMAEAAREAALEKARREARKIEGGIKSRWPSAVETPSGLRRVVLKEGEKASSPRPGRRACK